MKLFFLYFIFAIYFTACITGVKIKAISKIKKNNILLVTENKNKTQFLFYENNKIKVSSFSLFEKFDHSLKIKRVIRYDSNIVLFLTQEHGIFIYSNKKEPQKKYKLLTHLSIQDKYLPSEKIRGVFIHPQKSQISIFVTYYTPKGTGVTECQFNTEFILSNCKTYNKLNSQLMTNFVHQVTSDMKGNIWFRYSSVKEAGVSRRDIHNKWKHYTRLNSELGSDSVKYIVSEKFNTGLKEDNVWFITEAGLAKFTYKDKEEVWKLYGEKNNIINKAAKIIGIQDMISDYPADISDVLILKDFLLISDKHSVYFFNGQSMKPLRIKNTGGIHNLEIAELMKNNDNVIVKIKNYMSRSSTTIEAMSLLNLKTRKVQKIKYWHFFHEYPHQILRKILSSKKEFWVLTNTGGYSKFAIFDLENNQLYEIKNLLKKKK